MSAEVHRMPCPTCTWPNRETVNMVCPTCGTDYSGDTGSDNKSYQELTTAHVVPRNDLVEHDADEDCACGPTPEVVKQDDGSVVWVITHHSLDGRERDE